MTKIISRDNQLARRITMCLGVLWLIDGILQLQPAMFTGEFVSGVLQPTLQGQPGIIASLVVTGIHVWSINGFLSNLSAALIQLFIGALLIWGQREKMRRLALWLSVIWATIIWIFGEGMGMLFTGSATFYTGAPGSALLYLILAGFLLCADKRPEAIQKMPAAAGILFLVGAALNLLPMFWRSTMLSMLAGMPAVSGWLGSFMSDGTVIGNLIAVILLFCIGEFLLVAPERPVGWVALAFLAIVWVVGQNLGGLLTFPFGTATDPNSAPILALFLLPLFG